MICVELVWCDMICYGLIACGMICCELIWYGIKRFDTIWYDVIRCNLIWCDMLPAYLLKHTYIYIYLIYCIKIGLLLKLRSSAMKGHAELDHGLLLPFGLLLGHLDPPPHKVLLLVLVEVDAGDLHCCSKPPKCCWPSVCDLNFCDIAEKVFFFVLNNVEQG